MRNSNFQIAKVQRWGIAQHFLDFLPISANFSLPLFIKVLLITKSVHIIFCQYNFIHLSEATTRGVLCKKVFFLRNFTKLIGKNLCHRPATLLKNRLWPEACNFIEKETLAQVFSCVFFLSTLFLQNISGRLLLIFDPLKLLEVERYIYDTINKEFHKATCSVNHTQIIIKSTM